MKFAIIIVFAVSSLVLFSPAATLAQRDYFTNEEIELIRDAQEIDHRIDVLTHAIDRRFAALNVDVGGPKISAKESDKWGELPKGTRLQLLFDVKRILQKAIDDIDNIAERPSSAAAEDARGEKSAGYAVLFPKAVRSLAAAARRYQPALKSELDKTTDNGEKGMIISSIEFCDQILLAVGKLPAEAPKKSGKDH